MNVMQMFSDPVILKILLNALAAGILVSLCASMLGVSLVLKRYSMIGDGLSHVGFGALSIAASLGFVTVDSLPAFLPEGMKGGIARLCAGIAGSPLPFTLVVVIALAFLILRMSEGTACAAMRPSHCSPHRRWRWVCWSHPSPAA